MIRLWKRFSYLNWNWIKIEKDTKESRIKTSKNSDEIEGLKFQISDQNKQISKQNETISELESETEELKKE